MKHDRPKTGSVENGDKNTGQKNGAVAKAIFHTGYWLWNILSNQYSAEILHFATAPIFLRLILQHNAICRLFYFRLFYFRLFPVRLLPAEALYYSPSSSSVFGAASIGLNSSFFISFTARLYSCKACSVKYA